MRKSNKKISTLIAAVLSAGALIAATAVLLSTGGHGKTPYEKAEAVPVAERHQPAVMTAGDGKSFGW